MPAVRRSRLFLGLLTTGLLLGRLPSAAAAPAGAAAFSRNASLRRSAGTVTGWGNDARGQLRSPAALRDVIQIAGGAFHTLALRAGGTVVAWGDGSAGQTRVPTGLTGVVQVAAGRAHSLALKADGTVVAWGANAAGQSTVPPGLSHVARVAAAGDHNLALTANGTLVAWGDDSRDQSTVPASLNGIVQVAPGPLHCLALRVDGTVVAWGDNAAGQADVPAGLTGVVQVAAGRAHSLALKADGTIVAWGADSAGPVAVPAGLTGVVQVAAGGDQSLALRADGTVIAWGTADAGAAAGLAGVFQIAAGQGHALALRTYAYVQSWAGSFMSTVSTSSPPLLDVTQVAAGSGHSVALKADGTVVAWGDNNSHQTEVPADLAEIAQVAAGGAHSFALRADGTVVAWGNNDSGEAAVPPGLTDVVQLAGGFDFSVALRSDGTVVAWGTTTSHEADVPPDLNGVVQIAASGWHSLALRADGAVVAWGGNRAGECSVPPGLTDVIQVAAGRNHSLALRADGTVVAWGANNYGQSNVPAGLTNVVQLVGGQFHCLALKADGTLVGWGQNLSGVLTPPAGLQGVVQFAGGLGHAVAVVALEPPAGTARLSAQPVFGSQIRVQWQDLAPNETGFQLQRDRTSAFAQPLTVTLAANTVRYADAGIEPNVRYYYRVRSYRVINGTEVASGWSSLASSSIGPPPAVPGPLTVIRRSDTSVNLVWTDTYADFTGFLVERKPGTAAAPGTFTLVKQLAVSSGTRFNSTDAVLIPGQTYTWRVRAFNRFDYSPISNTPEMTMPLPPTAPANVTAAVLSSRQVQVSWQPAPAGTPAVTGYQVYRRQAGLVATAYRLIATLPVTATEYLSADLTQGTTYQFQVCGVNSDGSGAPGTSAPVTTLTSQTTPMNVQATALSGTTIRITWSYSGTDGASFQVERKAGALNAPGTFQRVTIVSSAARAAQDPGLTPETVYTYRVRALDGRGTADPLSSAASASTLP